MNEADLQAFNQFLQRIQVVGLLPSQTALLQLIIQLRQQYRLPLPDAIIAGTALQLDANLVTADQQLHNIQELTIVDFA